MSALEKVGYAAMALSIVANFTIPLLVYWIYSAAKSLMTWPARFLSMTLGNTRVAKTLPAEYVIVVKGGHVTIWHEQEVVSDSSINPDEAEGA